MSLILPLRRFLEIEGDLPRVENFARSQVAHFPVYGPNSDSNGRPILDFRTGVQWEYRQNLHAG